MVTKLLSTPTSYLFPIFAHKLLKAMEKKFPERLLTGYSACGTAHFAVDWMGRKYPYRVRRIFSDEDYRRSLFAWLPCLNPWGDSLALGWHPSTVYFHNLMFAFETKDGVTLAIAAVGAVLGIINTWHNLDQKRVKLRVTPMLSREHISGKMVSAPTKEGYGGFVFSQASIEVVNLSVFPVTIEQVGFTIKGTTRKQTILSPNTHDSKPFPRRLEQHEAATVYFDLKDIRETPYKAYATTTSGVTAYGTSPVMKEIISRYGQQPQDA